MNEPSDKSISAGNLYGQDCWTLSTATMELFITKEGGHVAPVFFYRNTPDSIQPYYINSWNTDQTITDPLIRILRGNFFCLPFGGECDFQGDHYGTHGETASTRWSYVSSMSDEDRREILLTMETTKPAGKIDKRITLVEEHNTIYTQHVLHGYSSRVPIGYHATLRLPEEEHSLIVSKNRGYTAFTPPKEVFAEEKEYSALLEKQVIDNLQYVETVWKSPEYTDCTQFPSRRGYSDLIQVYDHQENDQTLPGWTAAAVPSLGYLWFSLKNRNYLPSTMLWISNGGRHFYPWNGSNRCLGLEDVCGYFATGYKTSHEVQSAGKNAYPTLVDLADISPYAFNYIEGVIRIPSNFKRVASVEFMDNAIRLTSSNDISVTARVNWEFIYSGKV